MWGLIGGLGTNRFKLGYESTIFVYGTTKYETTRYCGVLVTFRIIKIVDFNLSYIILFFQSVLGWWPCQWKSCILKNALKTRSLIIISNNFLIREWTYVHGFDLRLSLVTNERFLRKYEASRNASWWEVCKGSSTYTTSLSLSVDPTDQTYSIT